MEFLGEGKTTTKQGKKIQHYIVEISEAEADMITGVAGKVHISGRYKAGIVVDITSVYEKVKNINEKSAQIKASMATVKANADNISNAITSL